MAEKWTVENIPDLRGKVAIVTGGNKGLGFLCVKELSKKGASVVIACRSKKLGLDAKKKIQSEVNHAKIQVMELDLLNDQIIETFAKSFIDKYDRLDILLNNAGVVNLNQLRRTKDGQEMHMATNHLGHFKLTGLLIPVIEKTEDARVVTVSSGAYRSGVIDFNDFEWRKRSYNRGKAYGDSKLANILFMRELQYRFNRAGINAVSVSAHPGLTGTDRQQTIGIGGGFSKMIASPVEVGVAPLLRAATEKNIEGGKLFGPKRFIWGPPVAQQIKGLGMDDGLSKELWKYTENLLAFKYSI
ncbi:SDR family NAD(P)-dependent oxidoreductase [Acidaminobacter sp. JC074]|uniref:oxidoreductase n=1 Tax=Acidaminobacter sp. JC074 TaxID=2530199 RepID=UPI001F1054A5|nr:oxidoreductase [Acidaminobacter sp. JC074]MCH4887821.1 SDR family NAD(P)-dependent oxidoreductase [Acidaminobacter sp. JC074]